jgi:fatty-acid peroxygenase
VNRVGVGTVTLVLRDLAVELMRHGYHALPRTRQRAAGADAVAARMLGRPALVVNGEAGARLFYDDSVTCRKDAVPRPLSSLLFGRGAVHGLDDDQHRRRKELFLRILAPEQEDRLVRLVGQRLDERAGGWPHRPPFPVFEELVRVYGGAVLDWAGTGCTGRSAEMVSRDLATILDGFGGAPMAYQRAWRARRRSEDWARRVLESARAGRHRPRPGSAVDLLTTEPPADLTDDVAAVELLNVLRPTVAVAFFGTFAALALVEHPGLKDDLRREDGMHREWFAHEVRRYYPFVPGLAARTRSDLDWKGHRLPAGARVVLDVQGIDHDPRTWRNPQVFDPERFRDWEPNAYQLVPQGGGHPETGHRCPGGGATIGMLAQTARVLAGLDYAIEGSPRVRDTRIPTRPSGGLVIGEVRVRG